MFEICADAPAVAGPESAPNIQSRFREDLSLLGGLSLN